MWDTWEDNDFEGVLLDRIDSEAEWEEEEEEIRYFNSETFRYDIKG